ncbi:ATP-binding protein [Geobacter sp. SVR]|uniref:ATP-binding protein n=1 Tax=Geobacter sp. SVR TaxID=2495594 RepID=UPI00143EFB07|nr:ATP-binding protein [Geobacter sp. SVR]BCS54476.1 hypothetical protein GSVR_27840 [Geobacter sp. SVR]GCF87075.1 histidine kinase [Geobacter sp. SVR]
MNVTDRSQSDGTAGNNERTGAGMPLQLGESHYRAMVEAFDGFVYVCSADYRIQYMNTRLIERTGRDATGETCYQALQGLDNVCSWCANEKVLCGESQRWEVKNPRDNRWYHISNTPILNADGIMFAQAVITDITTRKMAEIERARYFQFFLTSSELMCIAGADGYFKRTNPSFSRVLGYSEQELQTRPLIEFIHPDDRQRTIAEIKNQLSGSFVTQTFENRYLRKDGTCCWLSWNAYFDERENVIFGIARDVTEQKRFEYKLAAAKDAAEAGSRAKSEFLANMSHEIRTPMNAIRGMAQLLEYTELSSIQKEYLNAILVSSDSLLSLINGILDFSKIEAGRLELEQSVFSLRRSIGDLVQAQMPLLYTKGLTIRTDIPDDIPDGLMGDQLRLKQIMLNLLGNAIKFTSSGGIVLSIAMQERAGDAVVLRFSVSDTGVGIKPEVREKIFDPFTQADDSTSRNFGGTGLGLSICAKLVKLMGGSIEVESGEGIGSTFHVAIPFIAGPGRGEHRQPCGGERAPTFECRPLHILLAEDNALNRLFLSRFLEKFGHTLESVQNGTEVVEKWEQNSYSLILMDIQMPGMDGMDATRLIREREKQKGGHTPIIALTAHALREDRQNFLDQGFDGYVSKPIEIGVMMEEVKRCLQGREMLKPL